MEIFYFRKYIPILPSSSIHLFLTRSARVSYSRFVFSGRGAQRTFLRNFSISNCEFPQVPGLKSPRCRLFGESPTLTESNSKISTLPESDSARVELENLDFLQSRAFYTGKGPSLKTQRAEQNRAGGRARSEGGESELQARWEAAVVKNPFI